MSEFEPYFDIFDPRRRSEDSASDRSAGDGEYRPRHPRKGLSSSGEYRSRHPRRAEREDHSGSTELPETESSSCSPSPDMEGGEDDFVVFNFDEARRRRQEREDRLNAQLNAAEQPRRVAQRIAESQPRTEQRPVRRQTTHRDAAVKRAADLAGKLSGYAQPLRPMSQQKGAGSSGRTRTGGSAPARPSAGRASGGGGKNGKNSRFAQLSTPAKAAVVAGCVVLAFLMIYYSALGVMLSGMNSLELKHRDSQPAAGVAEVQLKSSPRVTNILLLGIDDDGGSGSRSDTIMIASLSGGSVRLCSILRDCYVEIPGRKSNRINAAYAYGGAQLAVETVENNFRVKIDHCVTIDMNALIDVVDAVGGVEIELTAAEANQVNLHSHCGLTTEAGRQLLNGKQAVTYARIRKIDNDFMRTQRQRTLINAIVARLRSLSVGELMGVVEAVAPNVATDMSSAQIASLALKALPALSNEMGQMSIPADGMYSSTTIDGMSVLKLNLEDNVKLLHSYIYDD